MTMSSNSETIVPLNAKKSVPESKFRGALLIKKHLTIKDEKMKNIIKSAIAVLALMATACSSDNSDENMQDPAVSVQAVTNLAVSGSWFISSYVDSGTDETADYNGYSFTFNADGTLVRDRG